MRRTVFSIPALLLLAAALCAGAPARTNGDSHAMRPAPASFPDPALATVLSALAKEGAGKGSSTGVAVYDLDARAWLFEHDADRSFNPASVTKVVTTVNALRTLGSGYVFPTHVYTRGPIADGVLKGDLVVRGEGDPSITIERLWRIATMVRIAGIKEVTGGMIIDDAYFDSERTGIGYEDFDDDQAYTAPLGAVSATWNTVAVAVRPGSKPGAPALVSLDPPTSYVSLKSTATTGAPGSRRRVSVTIDKRGITVKGSMPMDAPEKEYYRPIDDPPVYFGTLLSEYLAEGGIMVHGKVEVKPVPDGAVPLFDFESEPLGVVVRDLNKFSNNFTAELILKAVGARAKGAPGTTAKGVDAEKDFLDSIGIAPGWVIKNGSGLTRDNEISPRLFVRVLTAGWDDFSVRGDFVASLAIAGEDGTLRHRMLGTPAEKSLRAKTGTVDGSTCIAGYVQAGNGHTLAFAILMNGTLGKTAHAVATQDKIGATLAAWKGDSAPGPDSAIARAASSPAPTPAATATP